jgi:hypothetical protein
MSAWLLFDLLLLQTRLARFLPCKRCIFLRHPNLRGKNCSIISIHEEDAATVSRSVRD